MREPYSRKLRVRPSVVGKVRVLYARSKVWNPFRGVDNRHCQKIGNVPNVNSLPALAILRNLGRENFCGRAAKFTRRPLSVQISAQPRAINRNVFQNALNIVASFVEWDSLDPIDHADLSPSGVAITVDPTVDTPRPRIIGSNRQRV